MKSLLLAASAALLLLSCSRSGYPGSEPYPVPPGQPVPGDPRYPDQSRIPGDPRYPAPRPSGDNSTSYPREGQRDGIVTIIKTGDVHKQHLPPGKAKKQYGSQSARVYAPGQRKKNGEYANRMATIISVPDQYASRSNSGQLYYNYRGNTYWKQNDGYYYLAATNNNNRYKQDDDDDDRYDREKRKRKEKGHGKNKHD